MSNARQGSQGLLRSCRRAVPRPGATTGSARMARLTSLYRILDSAKMKRFKVIRSTAQWRRHAASDRVSRPIRPMRAMARSRRMSLTRVFTLFFTRAA